MKIKFNIHSRNHINKKKERLLVKHIQNTIGLSYNLNNKLIHKKNYK